MTDRTPAPNTTDANPPQPDEAAAEQPRDERSRLARGTARELEVAGVVHSASDDAALDEAIRRGIELLDEQLEQSFFLGRLAERD